MGNRIWSRLAKDSIGHGKTDILLQLAWVHSALFGQRKIVDISLLRNKVRDLEMADVSHRTNELKLANCELASPTPSMTISLG